jgi:LysM domain
VRRHYQHIVLHDFLKRVADPAVVDRVIARNRFYDALAEPFFLPLEFTVAGFRFGHTMVRDTYDFNLNFNPASLGLLFTFTALSGELGDFDTLPDNWIIQWERFVAAGGGRNKARRFDTKLADGLFNLQTVTGEVEQPADLLAEARHHGGQRLGPVGGTLVAEVLVGLVRCSEDSILGSPGWVPSLPAAKPGRFDLADLLRFAKVVGGGAAPRTYKVKSGDTLSGIAAKQLGKADRWPELFVLNRAKIRHRDRLSPGQVLVILQR